MPDPALTTLPAKGRRTVSRKNKHPSTDISHVTRIFRASPRNPFIHLTTARLASEVGESQVFLPSFLVFPRHLAEFKGVWRGLDPGFAISSYAR